MDPAQALADLTEISAQIEAAVIASEDGEPLASTLPDDRAAALARAGRDLLLDAGTNSVHVEAATADGSLFVARADDRVVSAVTGRGAPSGLVLYDLRTCLRRLAEEPEQPKPRRRRTKKAEGEAA